MQKGPAGRSALHPDAVQEGALSEETLQERAVPDETVQNASKRARERPRT